MSDLGSKASCRIPVGFLRRFMKVNVKGHWKDGRPWVNVNGNWQKAVAEWVNVKGDWKRVAYEVDHVTIRTAMKEIVTGFSTKTYNWSPKSISSYSMSPSDYPLNTVTPIGSKYGRGYRAGTLTLAFDDTSEGHTECARLAAALNSGKASVTVTNDSRPTSTFTMDSSNSLFNVLGNTTVKMDAKTASSVARVYESTKNGTLKIQIDYKG